MKYTLKNNELAVTVSTTGAEMQSIRCRGQEYLWQGDPAYWEDHAPLLFPFVGRFTNGQYQYNGQTYDMTIHGFAKRSEFSVKEQSETAITLTLSESPETLRCYPFRFTLDVTYALTGPQVQISYRVHNPSEDFLYFGIGGHPGFQVPLEEGLSFTDYCLAFSHASTPDRVGHTPALFLSGVDKAFPLKDGTTLPLSHDMFDEDAIVLKNVADQVTLRSPKGTRSVTVSYPDLPYLGLWHAPKTEAPYICIEPWTSLPSRQDIVEDFAYKSDLIRLKAGDTFYSNWSITLT